MRPSVHITVLAIIATSAVLLWLVCRKHPWRARTVRLTLGYGLAVNEVIWWVFRYAHEGIRISNLPLQLCDASVWAAVAACIVPLPILVEFVWFPGVAGAGMALITPDFWSPWPSYPAIYFFLAHGAIVVAAVVLVFGGIRPLRRNAIWRASTLLVCYAAFVGLFNAVFHTNYMYLCEKPKVWSPLVLLGPWPWYLFGGAAIAFVLFALLTIPLRPSAARR